MSVNIHHEWTPNPATLKYVVDRKVLPSGAMNFTSPEVAKAKSPLASRLMGIKGVVAVMLGGTFVTVTKGDEGEWDELDDQVTKTLQEHLEADQPVLTPEALESLSQRVSGGSEIEQRIRQILESEIRPAVMMDGGDIVLERFEDGVAYVHMQGSCSGCPSSSMTLRMGIETRLRDAIPELNEVVAV